MTQRHGGQRDRVDRAAGRRGVEAGDEAEAARVPCREPRPSPCEPSSTLRPLNEAPLTASVNCLPSDASVVLMLAMSRAGVGRLGQRRFDRVDRGDDRVDRRGGGRQHRLALRQRRVGRGDDAAVGTQAGWRSTNRRRCRRRWRPRDRSKPASRSCFKADCVSRQRLQRAEGRGIRENRTHKGAPVREITKSCDISDLHRDDEAALCL